MDRASAAAMLGVATDATPSQVHGAFRRAARSAHPDAGGSRADFDRLVAARDALLEPEATPNPKAASGQPASTQPSPGTNRATRPPGATRQASPEQHSDRSARPGCLWLILSLAALAVAAIVTIAIVAGTSGSLRSTFDPDDEIENPLGSCLLIGGVNEIEQVECDVSGALEVVQRFSGARTCGPGLDTLVSGDLTICLRPADR